MNTFLQNRYNQHNILKRPTHRGGGALSENIQKPIQSALLEKARVKLEPTPLELTSSETQPRHWKIHTIINMGHLLCIRITTRKQTLETSTKNLRTDPIRNITQNLTPNPETHLRTKEGPTTSPFLNLSFSNTPLGVFSFKNLSEIASI